MFNFTPEITLGSMIVLIVMLICTALVVRGMRRTNHHLAETIALLKKHLTGLREP